MSTRQLKVSETDRGKREKEGDNEYGVDIYCLSLSLRLWNVMWGQKAVLTFTVLFFAFEFCSH